MRLLDQVEEAARVIAPLWPLSNSIAVNPLWDLRQMPFDEAVLHARDALGISGYPSLGLVAKEYASGRIADEDIQTAIDSYFEIINLGNDNIHSEKKALGQCFPPASTPKSTQPPKQNHQLQTSATSA